MSEAASQPSAPKSRFAWRQLFVWGAWQPLTGGGVARFADASGVRVLTLQLLYSVMVSVVVLWSFRQAWFPAVVQALPRLPVAGAGVRGGSLTWPGMEAELLSERPQLSLSVDPRGTGAAGRSGDIQVEFRQRGFRLEGLFGHQELPYPPELDLPLDRTGATAAWGAWSWAISALTGLALAAVVVVAGWLVATLLALPLSSLAWLLGRSLSPAAAWRVGLAASLTGWGCLGAGLVLYATAWIRLPGLAAAVLGQVLVVGIWSLWALSHLPRRGRAPKVANPFGADRNASEPRGGGGRAKRGGNPFR